MTANFSWLAFFISLLLLGAYEVRAHLIGRHDPARFARYANANARVHWVEVLSAQPGFEIVAVQALRNSLMSATISASTAALAVMGALTLIGTTLVSDLPNFVTHMSSGGLHTVLQTILVTALFASYICSTMAMRYYGHASFIMSMPVGSAQRVAFNPMAADHVRRAGLLYGWGLRLFLMVAPLVAGVVFPLAMPLVTLLLLVALHFFDQPARLKVD
ncbi:MAG: hypothetical protein RL211_916 [Pseudomonadota bacterium]|jgi:hypothetical protein